MTRIIRIDADNMKVYGNRDIKVYGDWSLVILHLESGIPEKDNHIL